MTNLNVVTQSEIERLLSVIEGSHERAALFATVCRINTLYMIARAGSGHIGSSFSCLDILAWLYLNELQRETDGSPVDVFFSSKGHDAPALYAVLIAMGLLPFSKIDTLRRLGGLPGHPDISIPNIAVNSGSLGMGISKAKGMILADRLSGHNRRFYIMTGDGELQEGQIWESLQGAANAEMSELTAIVDHNKIQSDHWVTSTSDLGSLEERFISFGWHVEKCDGHNLLEIDVALGEARKTAKPSVIIADTIKGKGVSFMEPTQLGTMELYQFHSGALSETDYARANTELIDQANIHLQNAGAPSLILERRAHNTGKKSSSPSEHLIQAYSESLVALGARNKDLVALDADLVLDCGLIPFRNAFPDRYFQCGIAEMDMVGQAGGLALAGKLPIVHSFACFLTTRANEQIYTNASEHTKIIYVGSLAGILPAGPGHSHQSVRDIALMSCVPGMTAIEPSNAAETAAALEWMVDQAEGPCYLRLTSIPVSLNYSPNTPLPMHPGQGVRLCEGSDAAVFAYGPVMLSETIGASKILEREFGVCIRVINMPWLNRIDHNWLSAQVSGMSHVFTIDNHYQTGGQGEKICAALAHLGLPEACRVKQFGIGELPVCGTNAEAMRHHGLDQESLAHSMREILGA